MSRRKPAELTATIREANDELLRATVVEMRQMDPPPTYQAIADALGLTRGRVGQICSEELGEPTEATS